MSERDDGYVDIDAMAESRRFMREQVRKAAAGGNDVCGHLLSLESLANETPAGSFIANTMQDYDDDGSDMDDI